MIRDLAGATQATGAQSPRHQHNEAWSGLQGAGDAATAACVLVSCEAATSLSHDMYQEKWNRALGTCPLVTVATFAVCACLSVYLGSEHLTRRMPARSKVSMMHLR
jgi:hypothetical protein